ncbi:MAG: diguanylate cyclase [Deltaproteobacteria bacterium]|nr:diguanylate cyclase [Deltaproteobacteria bacterium]
MVGLPLKTVGRKIALAIGLPLVLGLLLVVEVSYRRAQDVVRQNAAEEAAALADLLATSFTLVDPAYLARPAPPVVAHRQVAAALQADFRIWDDVEVLRVVDREGVVRWSRRIEDLGTKVPDPRRLIEAPPQGFTDVAKGEYVRPLGGMACARCHSGDAFKVGAVQAIISRPRIEDDLIGFYHGVRVFLAVLIGVLALSSMGLLYMQITRPIGRLVEVMQRAEKGDFLVRAKVESEDEIGRLAGAFNSMVSRITEMKVAEIETSREIETLQLELDLKAELERQNQVIEETNRALNRRVREVTLLNDIARSLNSTLALPEILSMVTEMVGVTVGVDQFAVMLVDETGSELQVAASFGYSTRSLADFRLPVGSGASGLAAKTREAVYVPDLKNDPRYLQGPHDPAGESSLLAVPMFCKEKLVGALNFVRFKKRGFSDNDIVLLQLVATQAAMAIVNARLYTETLELTHIDPLTGLFNRRKLFNHLEMEVARSQRFESHLSVVMIDIDHFKNLNDTCGHRAGDTVLRRVAELLHGTVRKVDTVARYGGEEFMVLLPRSDRVEGLEVAEKLRRAIEQTSFEQGATQPGGRVTISVGVATFPEDAETLERLVDAVDSALYASKRGGRNRVTPYQSGMELHPDRERGPLAEMIAETEKKAAS